MKKNEINELTAFFKIANGQGTNKDYQKCDTLIKRMQYLITYNTKR